jgi:hypothetical protein
LLDKGGGRPRLSVPGTLYAKPFPIPDTCCNQAITLIKNYAAQYMDLIPVMRMPPDFLDVEGDAAAEVDGAILFSHAEALVVLEGLE